MTAMIDWSRVELLRDEVGAEDFEEIAALFLEEVESALAGLTPEMSATEHAEACHFLKGSALNLGFTLFAEACHRGETACGIDAPRPIAPLRETYTTSKAAFLEGLS